MLRNVRWVHGRHGRLVVAPRGAFGTLGDGHAMRPGPLDVHAWLADPTQRPVIIDLLRESLGMRVDLQRTDLREYAGLITRAFESGDLRARKMKLPHLHRDRVDEAPPPVKPKEEKQKHVLDFVVEYPNGDPAPGYEYLLIHPSRKREDGTLGEDATIHRDGVDPGSYGLHIKEVDRVTWDESASSVAEEVHLTAFTSGFPDGTAAKIRIFREYAEADDQVLDTFQAKVEKDRVVASYKYDDAKGDRKNDQGTARLVAEVTVGKSWAKTAHPVEMQLKTLVAVEWSPPSVYDGEEVEVLVRATGYADGTTAEVKLWRFEPDGDDVEVATFSDVVLTKGVATVALQVVLDDTKKKALEGTTIAWPGELHARVKVGKDPSREGASKLVSVEPALREFISGKEPGGTQ